MLAVVDVESHNISQLNAFFGSKKQDLAALYTSALYGRKITTLLIITYFRS